MSSSSVSLESSSSLSSRSLAAISSDDLGSQLSTEDVSGQVPASSGPKYYLILIPNHGDHKIVGFDDSRSMIKALMRQLVRKSAGKYKGEVLVFHGTFVEYSDPILSVRLNLPGEGEFSVSESSKGKYTRRVPKTG